MKMNVGLAQTFAFLIVVSPFLAPHVHALPPATSKPAKHESKADTAQHPLQKHLEPAQLNRLKESYARIAKDLDEASKAIAPLLARSQKGESIEWNKLRDGAESPVSKALNRIASSVLDYDEIGGLMQMSVLTDNPSFKDQALKTAREYSITFGVPSNGQVPAYRNHVVGLMAAARLSDDPLIRKAAILQATNAPYIELNSVTKEEIRSPFLSREAALALRAMSAKAILTNGSDFNQQNFSYHLAKVTDHLRLWESVLKDPKKTPADWPRTVNAEYQGLSQEELGQVHQPYVRPFMVALSEFAVLSANQFRPNERKGLEQGGKTLRAMMGLWEKHGSAFPYTDRDLGPQHKLTQMSSGMRVEATPDLYCIIGAAYIQVGERLKDRELEDFGVKIFKLGLLQMYTGDKQSGQALNGFAEWLLTLPAKSRS